jgi:hypothetical protein
MHPRHLGGNFLAGGPDLGVVKRQGGAVLGAGVLIHDASRLRAAATVLAVELKSGDGILTDRALERDAIFDSFDGVMSHSFIVVLCGG